MWLTILWAWLRVAKIKLENNDGRWRPHAQLGMHDLPYSQMAINDPNPVTGLRIKLCLQNDEQLCGQYSDAEIVEVCEAHFYAGGGVPQGAYIAIAIVVAIIAIGAVCLLVKCCCCNKAKPKKLTKEDIAGPNRVQQNQSSTDADLISMQQFIEKERQKRRYRASIQTTGWKNIDRIIEDQAITSLKNRTTTTIQNNEKKATISFTDYEVSIKNSHTFEQLFVYVVPKEFNSYIRLQSETNRFNYRLNDLLNYDVYCIAYQHQKPFFFRKEIKNTTDEITLVATTTEKLQQALSQLDSGKNALQTEINYQNFRLQNDQKLKSYREIRILKRELKSIVFPCKRPATLTSLNVLFRDVAPIDSIIIDNREN